MDGATVDKQALSNYVMSVPTVPKAVHMDLLNAAMLLAEGKCKNADYIAFGAITVILSTPGGGVHCVIVCGDTASDEVLAAAMIKTVPAGGCWKYIKKRSVFHLSGNTQKTFCLLCRTRRPQGGSPSDCLARGLNVLFSQESRA